MKQTNCSYKTKCASITPITIKRPKVLQNEHTYVITNGIQVEAP